MLRLRLLSALFYLPLVFAMVYLGGCWFALLVLTVINLAMYGSTAMFKKSGYRLPSLLGYAGVSAILILTYLQRLDLLWPVLVIIFLALLFRLLWAPGGASLLESVLLLWGIIYLGGLSSFILALRLIPEGLVYTFILLAGVFAHDSLAYFIGTKWGRRRMAPSISPKKSWEGAIGALLGTVALALLAAFIFPQWIPFSPGEMALLAAGLAVAAQLGDLLESAMKRQIQVKDAGLLVPGHGGFMDRLDSITIAAVYLYGFILLVH